MRPPTHPSVISFRLPYEGRVLMTVRSLQHDETIRRIQRVAAASRAAAQPTETASSLRQGHTPDLRLLASQLVLPLAPVGLLDRLPADAQRLADLAPSRPIAACCSGQQVAHICECVLGVSHLSQRLQGPLWSSQRPLQPLDGPAGPQSRLGAFLGAHVNGSCSVAPTDLTRITSTSVDPSICDTHFSDIHSPRVASTPFPQSAFRYRSTTEKKRPRAGATAGVVDGIRCN